jgi:hypothetical protein
MVKCSARRISQRPIPGNELCMYTQPQAQEELVTPSISCVCNYTQCYKYIFVAYTVEELNSIGPYSCSGILLYQSNRISVYIAYLHGKNKLIQHFVVVLEVCRL